MSTTTMSPVSTSSGHGHAAAGALPSGGPCRSGVVRPPGVVDVVDQFGRGLPQRTLNRFASPDLRALQGLCGPGGEVATGTVGELGVGRELHDDVGPVLGVADAQRGEDPFQGTGAGSSRPSPVALKPGQQQATATPVPWSRRPSSWVNMMSISLDRAYRGLDPRRVKSAVKWRRGLRSTSSAPICPCWPRSGPGGE